MTVKLILYQHLPFRNDIWMCDKKQLKQLSNALTAMLGLFLLQSLTVSEFTVAAENKFKSNPAAAPEPLTKPEIYGQGVRETPWQTPEQELRGFHLPDGFEVRLFASEPMITKPMNLAFDDRNRLWLTQTVEYPYPAKEGTAPRDAVMILEDTDGDGQADRSTQFADNLNIPIGILPYGEGCICFSIPNLVYLRDTDGDGRCDQRDVVLGPFDTSRDTHGMVNALRDGGDGWIYACHGFNNQSQIAGSDGHKITMNSGNTFRFRADGSRVEHVTHGQVNPFGQARDEWGYRYSADCHSKPITQLIFGACYPSFGRPHDGLGFLPPMLNHLHGSTAICGIVSYPSDSVIPMLRNQMLSGNVMTSRINRNQVSYTGATARGEERPDFMTSDDPWFRPVDLQIGRDSHLYVADFYNKIIGHYEVPLQHPERDRHSGRIWQIRFQPPNAQQKTTRFRSDNRTIPEGISERINDLLFRSSRGQITTNQLIGLTDAPQPQLAVAALRLITEKLNDPSAEAITGSNFLQQKLDHNNPHMVQAAAMALGRHGKATDIAQLLKRLETVDPADVVLRQTIRIAVRDILQRAEAEDPIWQTPVTETLAAIYLGLNRSELSVGLLQFLEQDRLTENRNALLTHAIKLAPESVLSQCISTAEKLTQGSPVEREAIIRQLLDSQSSSTALPDALRRWVGRHVKERLQFIAQCDRIVGWEITGGGEWPRENRKRQGGGDLTIASSLGRGESYIGEKISDPFNAPDRIQFWIAGHNGFPDQPSHQKNRVQLIRCSDATILREVLPPRSDIAIPVTWELKELNGESVQIKIIDGDADNAYAWLGLGDFEPSWIGSSNHSKSIYSSLDLIEHARLVESVSELQALLESDSISEKIKISIARTLAILGGRRPEATLLQYAAMINLPSEIVAEIISEAFISGERELVPIAQAICKRLTQSEQLDFSRSWISNGARIEDLVRFSELGFVSPTALANPEVIQLLETRWDEKLRQRHYYLTKDLDINQERQETLQRLQNEVQMVSINPKRGKTLFTQHCVNCHQLGGIGQVVGPQLDGAIARSVERLLEDIATPNRNVDYAFRTTSLVLEDGRVLAGLITHETEQQITLVDPAGKPIQINPDEVIQRKQSSQSLMPNNFSELLKPDEFRDLIGYLKSWGS